MQANRHETIRMKLQEYAGKIVYCMFLWSLKAFPKNKICSFYNTKREETYFYRRDVIFEEALFSNGVQWMASILVLTGH